MASASINIDQLIREAELRQQQLTLETQFQRNLAYFKTTAPALYQAFENYQASTFQLQFVDGHWDLLELRTRKLLYNQDPQAYSDSLVNKFLHMPYCYRVSILPIKAFGTDDEAHIGNINPMLESVEDAYKKHPEPRKPPVGADCPLLIINGIGLGFHIAQFIQRTCVHHLCIVEPDPDIIYASLHTVDWQIICEEFAGPGRSINLVLAQNPKDGADQLIKHINSIGLFNCAKTYIFTHLKNQVIKETTDIFVNHLTLKVGGLGYFDDERIGFAHTIENIRRGVSMLDLTRPYPPAQPNVPAIVVANGPSLDKAADMLRFNQDKAIIISCGTALGSLYQLGIKPDFHVEMERTRPVIEWIEAATDSDYRKNIVLLGLNTIHPDVFGHFERNGIALKVNDVGSLYLLEKLNKVAYNAHLEQCNPTVGNTGLAFAAAFGFKSIYLVGLDLGFSQSGQHHSNYSAHYRIKEEDIESLDLRTVDSERNVKLPGNFGGEVTATSVYASARNIAQKLLQANPAIQCFNTSEGVLIEGASPKPADEVRLPDAHWNKAELIDSLLRNHQLPSLAKAIPTNNEIIKYFGEIINSLNNLIYWAEKPATTIPQVREILQTIHDEALKLKETTRYGSACLMIRGSIDSFLLVLARCLYTYTEESEVIAIYCTVRSYFISFLQQSVSSFAETLFDLDERERKLANKFKDTTLDR